MIVWLFRKVYWCTVHIIWMVKLLQIFYWLIDDGLWRNNYWLTLWLGYEIYVTDKLCGYWLCYDLYWSIDWLVMWLCYEIYLIEECVCLYDIWNYSIVSHIWSSQCISKNFFIMVSIAIKCQCYFYWTFKLPVQLINLSFS